MLQLAAAVLVVRAAKRNVASLGAAVLVLGAGAALAFTLPGLARGFAAAGALCALALAARYPTPLPAPARTIASSGALALAAASLGLGALADRPGAPAYGVVLDALFALGATAALALWMRTPRADAETWRLDAARRYALAALAALMGAAATLRAPLVAGAILGALLTLGGFALAARRGHAPGGLPLAMVVLVGAGALAAFAAYATPAAASALADVSFAIAAGTQGLVIAQATLLAHPVEAPLRQRAIGVALLLIVGVALYPAALAAESLLGVSSDVLLAVSLSASVTAALVLLVAKRATVSTSTTTFDDDAVHYVEERRRVLYRAVLERAHDEDLTLTPQGAREVTQLRRRLQVTPEEHDAILTEVREHLRRRRSTRAPGAPAPEGHVLLERYRVDRLLGAGGSGWTYRCHDKRLARDVAVKEIPLSADGSTLRALREARLLAGIHHPNVIALHDVHETPAGAYLVMELARGGSLSQRLERGALRPEETLRLVDDMLRGLAAIHAQGLVHRDLKPSNVLLDDQGTAKLADLGIARAHGDTTISSDGRAGTPLWMAPEQVLGDTVDARTDLYALGAIAYECLVGASYVREAVREGMLVEEAIVSAAPPLPLAGVPDWANAFLTATLAKDPSLRPTDAKAALALLAVRRPPP